MLQNLIVFLIVMAAALYAARALWHWLPLAWRRNTARRLIARAQSAGLMDARRAHRLAAALTRPSGCGACQDCAGCKPAVAPHIELSVDAENRHRPAGVPPAG